VSTAANASALGDESLIHAGEGGEALGLEKFGRQGRFLGPRKTFCRQESVSARIYGSERCHAEGFTVRGSSPVLAICRRLVEAGFDPDRPLHAYRGDLLCLVVRSIGEGANLTVKERPFGPVFETWKGFPTPPVSPPMRQKRQAATRDRNRPPRALSGGSP
jgi:hypothetical protein